LQNRQHVDVKIRFRRQERLLAGGLQSSQAGGRLCSIIGVAAHQYRIVEILPGGCFGWIRCAAGRSAS
jgi:hypothetical protein